MEDIIMAKPLLTDELWQRTEPHIPPEPPKGGRPRVPDRACLTDKARHWLLSTPVQMFMIVKWQSPWSMQFPPSETFTGGAGQPASQDPAAPAGGWIQIRTQTGTIK